MREYCRLPVSFKTIYKEYFIMEEVHFTMQGKGGAGKSFVTSILAQYLKNRVGSQQVMCFDTDPINPTLSRYSALNPQIIHILENGKINSRHFDELMEMIENQDGIGVVDTGAGTFVPLMYYFSENHIPDYLFDCEVNLVVHVPIVGGQAFNDCLIVLEQILGSMGCDIVIWLNHFQGKIQNFKETKVYQEYQDRIIGIVEIQNKDSDTFGKDLERMTEMNLTFDEVQNSSEFKGMARNRLKHFGREMFEALDKIPFIATLKDDDESSE
ncbi:cobalamin biosynthesis protein CobQ [Kingella kingae]|uniref:nucleotide-binding protein n=1 Tax=Kingella kingae TaxID=504 RepID=UPI002550F1C2|nr:cobalamin biosynthesis protein CobQ [Kingella kingae]MDK4527039.1 cobalamin biosynthesis protein CobQ [Kingella kingae]